jgi:hypothetical protein
LPSQPMANIDHDQARADHGLARTWTDQRMASPARGEPSAAYVQHRSYYGQKITRPELPVGSPGPVQAKHSPAQSHASLWLFRLTTSQIHGHPSLCPSQPMEWPAEAPHIARPTQVETAQPFALFALQEEPSP